MRGPAQPKSLGRSRSRSSLTCLTWHERWRQPLLPVNKSCETAGRSPAWNARARLQVSRIRGKQRSIQPLCSELIPRL
jgi:hypothetical protein